MTSIFWRLLEPRLVSLVTVLSEDNDLRMYRKRLQDFAVRKSIYVRRTNSRTVGQESEKVRSFQTHFGLNQYRKIAAGEWKADLNQKVRGLFRKSSHVEPSMGPRVTSQWEPEI